MTATVFREDGSVLATYAEGVKAVREFTGVLRVYSDREKTNCIGMHNANFWSHVEVTGTKYPYEDGDFIAIGPESFMSKDASVLSYRGENYYRSRTTEEPKAQDV